MGRRRKGKVKGKNKDEDVVNGREERVKAGILPGPWKACPQH